MSKICIDARMYNHSGIGKYLQMLLPGICKQFDVTLLGDPAMLSSLASAASIVPFNAPIYSILEQRQYRKAIGPTDLFWSPHYNAPQTSVRAINRVATIHDVYHLAFSKEMSLKQRLYAKLVMGNTVKASDSIITVSDFSKSEIIKYTGCDPDKIFVIYNGVEKYPEMSLARESANNELPGKYILFVGNVKPHKNLRTLLKAYLLLSDMLRAAYKVVIVGKKDGFVTGDSELIDWVNSDNKLRDSVVFTGYVDDKDMGAIYSNSSLLVFPSLYEGFGLPPLEAMARGCPVIAANTSSIPEVCGDAAVYFSPMDEHELSVKMTAMLTDEAERQRLIRSGLERTKLFGWKDAVDKHAGLFNQLLDQKNK